jgi:hypothetical protein
VVAAVVGSEDSVGQVTSDEVGEAFVSGTVGAADGQERAWVP